MTGRGKGPRRRGRIAWALTERGMAEAARQDRIEAGIRAERAREVAAALGAADDPYAVLRLLQLDGQR